MKRIEKIRCRLNKAITSGDSTENILNISRYLDNLIVEKMKIQKSDKLMCRGQ